LALRDLALVILGLILFVAGVLFVFYLAAKSVGPTPRQPHSIATVKYQPNPRYETRKTDEEWAKAKERSEFEILY